MKEKEIETQILRWLNFQKDVYAFKINTVGVYDQAKGVYRTNRNPFLIRGTADILGLAYGRFIAIECKTPKTIKNVSDNQKAFLMKIVQMGGYGLVACRLDDVVEWLEKVKGSVYSCSPKPVFFS